ncbi:DNA-binding response regulator [Paenibacillus sp. LMG 31457]|uniref:DNA-binding response regulator n=2 Tax=Paenibacillus planticolens TaxID=2654976 RepID=A0ABX1ZJB7_9BACL|nr:DNA-binding response regulator [Paenibacillus planticolens]
MSFENEYKAWVGFHEKKRSGERLRRMREGLGHAEHLFLQQVWWPVIRHFRQLHPEYEVKDYLDGTRFIDFAYLRPPYCICIEMDGFGPHARDIDRTRFGDNLMRQNQLMLNGWKVFRFAVDDITGHQRRCQQVILSMMGRWYGDDCGREMCSLTYREKEIARLAASAVDPLKPQAVAAHLGIRVEHARKWLHSLHRKGIIKPASGGQRVRSYVLDPSGSDWSVF